MTAQQLFKQCADLVNSYPPRTCGLSSEYPVAGRGFFSVASGSFHDGRVDIAITPRKFMFVGQDWGAKTSLCRLKKDLDDDMKSSTVINLRALLADVGIQQEDCFFTNSLFGVRDGKTSTGRSPGWKDEEFVAASAEALKLQIDVIQPSAIICLGRDAPQLLALFIPECKVWHPFVNFKAIDDGGHGVLPLASKFGPIVAAILTHPSYRHINAKHRCFDGIRGQAAEVQLLKSVCSRIHSLGDQSDRRSIP